jgi:hypothetical protein
MKRISADQRCTCKVFRASVGPFPQEPPFESPGAVEQAAETIRGFAPGPWAARAVPVSPVEECGGTIHAADGTEIACVWRKREEDRKDIPEAAANARLIAAAPDLLRERDELRAEVANLAEAALAAADQRDALADALENLRADWADTYCEYCTAHAPKKETGVPCGRIPHFGDCNRAAAEAALRLAGRLP